MSRFVAVLVAAASGAALALLLQRTFDMQAPAQQPALDLSERGTPEPPTPAPVADPDASPALARLESGLARISDRIDALARKVDELAARSTERVPVSPGGTGPVEIDEAALARAFQRLEASELEQLSVHELLRRSERQTKEQDFAAARRTVEAALARPANAEERARMLTQLGNIHMHTGDLQSAQRVLGQVVDEFGIESVAGASAAQQLVWVRSKGGDPQGAMQLAHRVAGAGSLPETMRVNARWAAAVVAGSTGDQARARAEFESLLREYGGRDEYRKLLGDVRNRLQNGK